MLQQQKHNGNNRPLNSTIKLNGAKEPSAFFTYDGAGVSNLTRFEKPAKATAFRMASADPLKVLDSHPQLFVVHSAEELKVIAGERGVKAALAIFQVQFVSSTHAKETGAGPVPPAG